MSPGSDDDGREGVGKGEPDDLALPTVVVDPKSQDPRADDLRTKVTPRVPRAYVSRTPPPPPASVTLPPPSADGPAPEEGADLASALEPHLAWLAEPQRSELFLVLLKGQFALALNALQEQAARFPRNVSIVRAMQMVERVAIHHIIGKLRPLERIPVVVELAQGKRVSPAVSELLKLCDGVASLEEILRRARTPRLATLQILQGLVERGGIVLSRPRHRAMLDEGEEQREPAPVTMPPIPLSERGLSAEAEEVLGRATYPDPVEARYQAALMPPPSGPVRRATLRGMPAVRPVETPPPPPDTISDTPTPLVMPPPMLGKLTGNDAPTARPPPFVAEALVRSALISIPNLELPPSEPSPPEAPPAAPSLTEEPTILPAAPNTEPPISSVHYPSGSSRRARGLGVGFGLVAIALAAVAIGVGIRFLSEPDAPPPVAVSPPVATTPNPTAPASDRQVVRLTVEISPKHATVTLDGGALNAPYRRELPRGDTEHSIEVEARGYKPRTATFRATGDASIIIALEPLPPKKGIAKKVGEELPPPPPDVSVEESPPPPPEDIDPYE